jgi:nucleoside-diphosphate-sugar epimerase
MIFLENKRVLLVGGAGFIGHNLALELKRKGAHVAIVDGLAVNNFLSFSSSEVEYQNADLYLKFIDERLRLLKKAGVPLYVQDARDYHLLNKIITKEEPQILIHLAAVSHANRSNKDPHSTFGHILRTLENSLDCVKNRIEHFVYLSSSMVYGNFNKGIVDEKTYCDPLGIYGALKFSGEKIVHAYNQVFDLPYTIIRPSALYGERCVSRRVGQIFIENAVDGIEISINGDGSDRLDFTYIDDFVSGVICSLESENAKNETFNITYGESRTIAQMAEILSEHFPGVHINYLPKDKLMPDRGTLSVDKARELINYNPQWPLEKGYVNYIKWYKSLI